MNENMNNTQASDQNSQQTGNNGIQQTQNSLQQQEKLFTQADVDRIVGNRLARLRQEMGDTDRYRRERDDARRELEQYRNDAFLKSKGVIEDYKDYITFEARKRMDDNTNFQQAAEKFLKENPRFTGGGYRVVSTGTPDGGSGGSFANRDAGIRKAMGLKG